MSTVGKGFEDSFEVGLVGGASGDVAVGADQHRVVEGFDAERTALTRTAARVPDQVFTEGLFTLSALSRDRRVRPSASLE